MTNRTTLRLVRGAFLGALAFALVAAGGTAATAATSDVQVQSAHVYSPTGITLHAGDTVEVSASGRIHFGGGKIGALAPTGIPWGAKCLAVAAARVHNNPWPAPGLPCWSLIARVGTGTPVSIGSHRKFRAAAGGSLLLGINDNFVGDNVGHWTAHVTVTPAAPPTSTPGNPGGNGSTAAGGHKSSKTGLFIVLGVIVLGLLLFVFFLVRRRSGGDAETTAPAPIEPVAPPVAIPVPPPPPVAPPPPPEPEPAPGPVPTPLVNAPPDPESIDVNIFEVEFTNGIQLRIGYNHFPDGTPVNWKVTQSRKPVAVGSFVAQGGGSTNHFETVPLGLKLEGRDTHPDGADVQFDWSINGVPFRYSVRRDPNC